MFLSLRKLKSQIEAYFCNINVKSFNLYLMYKITKIQFFSKVPKADLEIRVPGQTHKHVLHYLMTIPRSKAVCLPLKVYTSNHKPH